MTDPAHKRATAPRTLGVSMVAIALFAAGSSILPIDAETTRWLTLLSLVFPAYYLIASWAVSWQIWRRRRSGSGNLIGVGRTD